MISFAPRASIKTVVQCPYCHDEGISLSIKAKKVDRAGMGVRQAKEVLSTRMQVLPATAKEAAGKGGLGVPQAVGKGGLNIAGHNAIEIALF